MMKVRIILLALISFCFLSVNAADKQKESTGKRQNTVG